MAILTTMNNGTDYTMADVVNPVSGLLTRGGVIGKNNGAFAVTEKGTPNLSVDVAPGEAFVTSDSHSAGNGEIRRFFVQSDATENVSIDSNSSGNDRIDIIVVKVDDTASVATRGGNAGSVEVVKGTAAASPSAPSVPGDAELLAEVLVQNGASSITDSDITDKRVEANLKKQGAWEYIDSTASRQADNDPNYTIRFSSLDLTDVLSVGMRLRFKQGGSFKYGIIHDVTLNSGDTDVAVFGGTDYDVGTGTLTDIYFSSAKVPYGFPVGVTKWQIDTGPGGTAQASPTGGTWYNLGGSITLPQGEWIVNIASGTFMKYSGQDARAGFLTLSTGNNTESNTDNTITNAFGFRDADNANEFRLYGHAAYTLFIAVSTETTYYLNAKASSGVAEIALNNARIYASNAYL